MAVSEQRWILNKAPFSVLILTVGTGDGHQWLDERADDACDANSHESKAGPQDEVEIPRLGFGW